jgi:hypothetical protein
MSFNLSDTNIVKIAFWCIIYIFLESIHSGMSLVPQSGFKLAIFKDQKNNSIYCDLINFGTQPALQSWSFANNIFTGEGFSIFIPPPV